jgi:hypothetical protein
MAHKLSAGSAWTSVKGFFGFLARHWLLSILFLLFVAPVLIGLLFGLVSKIPFLGNLVTSVNAKIAGVVPDVGGA